MTVPTGVRTAAAVAVAAALGGAATDVGSRWYTTIRKPSWQPPGAVFGPVWTVLYALIAVSAARALARADPGARRAYWRALAVNLAVNAGWSFTFFRAHRPGWATAHAAVLEASTLGLIARTRRLDGLGAGLLVPYALWGGYATALSGRIAATNRPG